jgi:hypothetical protein
VERLPRHKRVADDIAVQNGEERDERVCQRPEAVIFTVLREQRDSEKRVADDAVREEGMGQGRGGVSARSSD